MKVEFDYMYRPRILSFGIDIGSNKFIRKKSKNLFIEISILFWSFSVEFYSKEWGNGINSRTTTNIN